MLKDFAMARRDRTFTHLDRSGAAHMVDVGHKPMVARLAVASACVVMPARVLRAIRTLAVAKGDVLAVARLAGIQAAKRASDLIPLCHPLPLDGVEVELALGRDRIRIRATVRTTWRTGVEMEALAACAGAALTVYDMCKGMSTDMVIGEMRVEEKVKGETAVATSRRRGVAGSGRSSRTTVAKSRGRGVAGSGRAANR